MMKVVLSNVVNGCRVGSITELGRHGNRVLEFPGCLLYTRCGAAPHLTYDVLQKVDGLPTGAQLTLPTLAEQHHVVQDFQQGIGKFTGMEDFFQYCSVQDPAVREATGYNFNKGVSVWGSGGRIKLEVADFMAIQKAFCPDWYQCLCDGDTTSPDTSNKRLRKSVDRTLNFLDECLEIHQKSQELKGSEILGVIEGGDLLEERLRSARETCKRPVAGFVLDGFQSFAMERETRKNLLKAVLEVLPEDKPRIIHAASRPDEVLEAVECGVDLFDSSFPFQVTERGCALVFPFSKRAASDVSDETMIHSLDDSSQETTENQQTRGLNEDTLPQRTMFEIDLNDREKYAWDFRPVLPGCSCYCCQNHSRAYIHHLLQTGELLARVLLMMHNFHHYFGFFTAIRESLQQGTFQELKATVTQSQGTNCK
ncbi:PREDICTED: queuine tRNA-ribosyltransferase accessory subunit 2-like [Branchiostoma belcheri]|uniref:Queuine tRNA-ribosyltransferase accessory subunit 2 n=1 Tax=Branchiostoma belcheri TaxID=7741 RepID=A0A6P4Y9X6_BRABE|nr:PREDICTED: queuine tRNA-ribosyltransferase accessory subunit 2-like [Branchiostoma belcheri]XP_019619110.1 PREDICTED: queuine tRNA-ribosyltransferase accessory subunit 2-like [Branchiostoma belcheri]